MAGVLAQFTTALSDRFSLERELGSGGVGGRLRHPLEYVAQTHPALGCVMALVMMSVASARLEGAHSSSPSAVGR
jgi:hypothetical protein